MWFEQVHPKEAHGLDKNDQPRSQRQDQPFRQGQTSGGDVPGHRVWMVRTFALILAAVTLRLQLPFLFWFFDGNETAVFAVVAWSAWLPNVAIAEWWLRRSRAAERAVQGAVAV